MFGILHLTAAFAGGAPAAIGVDQIGYRADSSKLATVVTESTVERFSVHRLPEGDVVFEGTLAPPISAPDSGQAIRLADFSWLNAEGSYELKVGELVSDPFEIRKDPYRDLLRLTMRSYYGQRCGIAVDLAPDSPGYEHEACHPVEGWHSSSAHESERESTGGWHDAGDYGRYVVNSGVSVGTLLWAWEMYPAVLGGLDLAIPESEDDVPDFLDEIRWNLDWMLSMQDEDGGVWHKQTGEDFAGMVMPEHDRIIKLVIGSGKRPYKSSCATASFAATMALAARVYQPFDPAFSERTGSAAVLAWRWVSAHPEVIFRNPEGVVTGEYGDADCLDERLWAAAEIWRTTGDASIERWFAAHAGEALRTIDAGEPPSWNYVGPLAAWTYAMSEGARPEIVSLIRRRSVLAADRIVERARTHGYRIPLETDDYEWGSNGVAANYALQLLVTNELAPDPAYPEAALEIVHYLLGRNPFSLSWVTGAGTHAVMHPHHRPSVADGVEAPWPGLLAGGPNRHRQDPALKALPPDTPPALMYVDEEPSYASNEIAINWNAPLVFVLAGVSP